MRFSIALVTTLFMLSGCGNSSSSDNSNSSQSSTAFSAFTRGLFANTSDTAEPVEINAINLKQEGTTDDFSDLL